MLSTEQLFADLTDEQRQAAQHVDGPLLIIAAAGSGKTRVITRRVAHLISIGIPPQSVLAITFTNKAAGEMKHRVSSLMDRPLRDFGRLDQPWSLICTFHSLGLRILKHYAERLKLPANFSVYDSDDQGKLIKEAIKLADLSTTNFTPSAVHHQISAAKNKLLSPEAYANTVGRDFFGANVAKVYRHYQRLLEKNAAMDFDDLLLRVAYAFKEHKDVLAELQERFQYILIDEYQDTNHAQYIIAHSLAQKHQNICVVGDPDQSIYAWRGADIQNILEFERDYPKAAVVKLEQNYRSTQSILDIASALISRNRQRKDKRLWTTNPAGDNARVFLCSDEQEESLTVASHFKKLKDSGQFNWNDFAVFYRINSLSRVMEDALRRSGIPYRVARGVDFYHRKEIKDVLAYLKVIANTSDELSLTRILNVPARGIGDTSVKQMQVQAIANQWNLWETLQNIEQVNAVTNRTINAARSFAQMIQRWQVVAKADLMTIRPREDGTPRGRLTALMEAVVRESGLEAHYKKVGDEEQAELGNVEELISSAAQFDEENPGGSLEDYLGQVSLVSDVDSLAESGAVTLMTLHSAKGLEFPVVSIIGMEEGCLPHARVADHPEQLEEERRLCFVGITRAQRQLILSRANYRTIRGLRERTAASRFLSEIPPKHLDVKDLAGSAFDDDRPAARILQQEESQRLSGQFHRGQMVRHQQFGVGRIVDISDMGQHTRAVIDFSRAGRKTLVLQYARLEPA